jgi:MFS family permease
MSEPSKLLSHFGGIDRALSTKSYRTYWTGQVVMVQGFWIYKIASGSLMWDLTESSAWLGALGSAYLLPIFFLGPFGGAVADRYGYRRMAMAMGGCGAAIALFTAIMTWFGFISPACLVFLTLIQGFLFAFEFPARQALFPNLVERKDIPAAVALNATTFHSSAFTGPLIGGVLLWVSGAGAGFAANAFCMTWMMIAIYFIPSPPNLSARLEEKKASGILNDLKDGLRYTHQHIDIRLLILLTIVTSLFIRPYIDFLPGFAGDVFNNGKKGLTALTAASGIGALFFASFFAIRGRTKGLISFMFIGQIGAVLSLTLFSFSDIFIFGLIAILFVGGFLVSASICIQSLIQHSVDDNYRARVVAVNVSLAVGAPALSAIVIGWIAEVYGLPLAMGGTAALSLIFIVPIGLKLRKRRREIEAVKKF